MNKNFEREFYMIWENIKNKKPMCFARYADGEVCLMTGKKIGNNSQAFQVDNWKYEQDGISEMGKELLLTLKNTDPFYYYAISCNCCDPVGNRWLLGNINQSSEYITFANLWINGNYNKFLENLFK